MLPEGECHTRASGKSLCLLQICCGGSGPACPQWWWSLWRAGSSLEIRAQEGSSRVAQRAHGEILTAEQRLWGQGRRELSLCCA